MQTLAIILVIAICSIGTALIFGALCEPDAGEFVKAERL